MADLVHYVYFVLLLSLQQAIHWNVAEATERSEYNGVFHSGRRHQRGDTRLRRPFFQLTRIMSKMSLRKG
jgi:hypothetical protein